MDNHNEDQYYNLQVAIEKTPQRYWKVADFVVVHQPEPWDFETFVAVMNCCCHLKDPPPDEFTWPHKPIIKVKIIRKT